MWTEAVTVKIFTRFQIYTGTCGRGLKLNVNNRKYISVKCEYCIYRLISWYRLNYGTHVKISQHVASLQTCREQVVFARLVASRQQVWNKLLTTCNNLVDIIRLVRRLFPHVQGCYDHDIAILLQPCVVNLVTFLFYHDCIRLVTDK